MVESGVMTRDGYTKHKSNILGSTGKKGGNDFGRYLMLNTTPAVIMKSQNRKLGLIFPCGRFEFQIDIHVHKLMRAKILPCRWKHHQKQINKQILN